MRQVTIMACSSGFPLRVMQSSSEGESITIANESISACDSLCGSIFCVSHLDDPLRFPQHKETFSFFFFSVAHCLDRIAPLIDLALMFPVKGFVCVVSLSRQHELMTISPSWTAWWGGYDGMVPDRVFSPIQVLPFFLKSCEILKPQPQNSSINWMSTPGAVSE